MKDVSPPPLHIAVEDLRVGMFVHLEGGWLAHPFPLSNFKLTSTQQIDVIRSLGLTRVRWSPDKSDHEGAPADQRPAPPARPTGAFTALTQAAALDSRAALPGHATATAAAQPPAAAAAERRHREALTAQHEALRLCERQFAEATQACKTLIDLIPARPQVAREQSEALSHALVTKMLGQGESCIRLLSEIAGDKASTHSMNVTVLSLLLGKAIGIGEAEMLDLGVGAMLHDIGKMDVPDRLRHRGEQFSGFETMAYQEHVAHGARQGHRMGLADGALTVIEQHHEHADGTGFPLRLRNDRMSACARIVALVNRYDNLCNPHLPSRALTPHESLSLMFAQGKSKFDAAILGSFIKMMGIYPPGSAVQLTDERYALVVAVNASRPLSPRVMVHDEKVAPDKALVLDLQSVPELVIRRSVKPLAMPAAALDYLSPRPRMAYFFAASAELEPQP
jgi:putative nucleotidyltransferase with HDIG domain